MFMHPLKPWVISTDLHTDMRYRTKMSACNHSVSVAEAQYHVIDPTNFCRAFNDGIEDRLNVCRRAADDAEDLRRCRLMFQRLTQFCIALLNLLEQSHVLDCNHRLICESYQKRNFLFGERMKLCST